MNAATRVLRELAAEPEAVMSSEAAHSLVMRRHPDKPIKLATVKRALRTLRAHGLADADDHYDRDKDRLVAHWWATDHGIRANLDG